MDIELEVALEVLGVDLSALASEKGELNLYSQFGKHPVAQLILKDDKFVLRFGGFVQPTSIVRESITGGVHTEPFKFKIERE